MQRLPLSVRRLFQHSAKQCIWSLALTTLPLNGRMLDAKVLIQHFSGLTDHLVVTLGVGFHQVNG